jgi:CBS domain-containing protein
MNIAEVMTTDVDCCTLENTCTEVAVKMKDLDVGVIPICENEKLLGVITDRDIVVKGLANKLSGESSISGLMTDNVVKGTKEMSVEEAANLMSEHQVRRLPIVENDKLVGIVSLGDLAVSNQSKKPEKPLKKFRFQPNLTNKTLLQKCRVPDRWIFGIRSFLGKIAFHSTVAAFTPNLFNMPNNFTINLHLNDC